MMMKNNKTIIFALNAEQAPYTLKADVVDNYKENSVVSSSDDSDPYNGYYGCSFNPIGTNPIGYDGFQIHMDNSMFLWASALSADVDFDFHHPCGDPCGDKGEQGEISIQTSSWTNLEKDIDEIILYDQLDQNNYLRF